MHLCTMLKPCFWLFVLCLLTCAKSIEIVSASRIAFDSDRHDAGLSSLATNKNTTTTKKIPAHRVRQLHLKSFNADKLFTHALMKIRSRVAPHKLREPSSFDDLENSIFLSSAAAFPADLYLVHKFCLTESNAWGSELKSVFNSCANKRNCADSTPWGCFYASVIADLDNNRKWSNESNFHQSLQQKVTSCSGKWKLHELAQRRQLIITKLHQKAEEFLSVSAPHIQPAAPGEGDDHETISGCLFDINKTAISHCQGLDLFYNQVSRSNQNKFAKYGNPERTDTLRFRSVQDDHNKTGSWCQLSKIFQGECLADAYAEECGNAFLYGIRKCLIG